VLGVVGFGDSAAETSSKSRANSIGLGQPSGAAVGLAADLPETAARRERDPALRASGFTDCATAAFSA
jgi:hypothetical protein